MEKIIQWGAT